MPSYLEDVELLFLSSVKKGLSLRAGDLEIVRDWERRGVPFEVISRGILNGIKRFLADSEPTAPVPSGLRYYRTAVEREFEIWQRAAARGMAGAVRQPAPGKKPVMPLLQKARLILVQRLANAPFPQKKTYSMALAFFDDAAKETPLVDLVYQVDDMLVTGLGQTLDPESFHAVLADVENHVRTAAGRGVGRRAVEELRRKTLRQMVGQRFGFESLMDAVVKPE